MSSAVTTLSPPLRNSILKPGNLLPAAVWVFMIALGLDTPFPPPLPIVGLVLINSVILFFLIIRRDAARVGGKMDTAIALAGTFSVTFLLDRDSVADTELFPTIIQAAGLLGWIWALFTLGRSFGIVAADRGLVAHGPYRLVRHPIYAFELLFFLGYFAAVPTLQVAVIVGIWTILQCVRIVREEKIIGDYGEYAQNVRWRLVPFIW